MKEWGLTIFLEDAEMYNQIDQKIKIVEGRASDHSNPEKKYDEIVEGDILVFTVINRKTHETIEDYPPLRFKVVFNHHYASAKEMLESEGLQNVFPGLGSVEEGVNIYHSFPGHEERIKENGIQAIGLGKKVE